MTVTETRTAGEIAGQPAVWRAVAREASVREAYAGFVQPLLARPEVRVVLAGAGTSAYAGDVLAPVLAARLRRRIDAVPTTDLVSNPRDHLAEDVPVLLVSFARSGDSPESVAAAELVDRIAPEAAHLVVTCNPDGRLARDHGGRGTSRVLLLPYAHDTGFAMTSSFTGMLLAARLALTGTPAPDAVDRLAAAADQVLVSQAGAVRDLAARVARRGARVVCLGSGPLKGLAREAALKILELTAGDVVAVADSTLGFRHGPKAVLDDGTLAVVLVSGDPYTRRYDLDLVTELTRSLPPERLVVLADRPDGLPAGVTPVLVGAAGGLDEPDGPDDAALALPAVVWCQSLALQLSLALGRTPDNPFPGGEVNRVVAGVTVHPYPS